MNSIAHSLSINESSDLSGLALEAKIIKLLSEFRDLSKTYGLPVQFTGGPESLARITPLPEAAKLAIYKRYAFTLEFLKEELASGTALSPKSVATVERSVLWRLIQKLELRPCSDLMENIKDNDIIEIYDYSMVQLYANPAFYTMCSYDLDVLFAQEWQQLFSRSEDITEALKESIIKLFSGGINSTVSLPSVGKHVVEEVFEDHNRKFLVDQGIISPLYMKGVISPVAFVATLQAARLPS